ncbi:hypothetical protein LZ30DRAFT_418888 [Colletotrichum cereale]|nr:hypothetical protein LZ30DRAFT_418888 [Colletotrichum cereale]
MSVVCSCVSLFQGDLFQGFENVAISVFDFPCSLLFPSSASGCENNDYENLRDLKASSLCSWVYKERSSANRQRKKEGGGYKGPWGRRNDVTPLSFALVEARPKLAGGLWFPPPSYVVVVVVVVVRARALAHTPKPWDRQRRTCSGPGSNTQTAHACEKKGSAELCGQRALGWNANSSSSSLIVGGDVWVETPERDTVKTDEETTSSGWIMFSSQPYHRGVSPPLCVQSFSGFRH